MEQWYTLYTKPRAEYQVKTVLQERDIQTLIESHFLLATCLSGLILRQLASHQSSGFLAYAGW
jgi:hypothetical protein